MYAAAYGIAAKAVTLFHQQYFQAPAGCSKCCTYTHASTADYANVVAKHV